jgi:hypothetical protein
MEVEIEEQICLPNLNLTIALLSRQCMSYSSGYSHNFIYVHTVPVRLPKYACNNFIIPTLCGKKYPYPGNLTKSSIRCF